MAKTVFTLLLLALTGTAVLAAQDTPSAPAAPAAPDVVLYDGKAAGPTTPSIAAWGGGSGQESTETYIFGGHSLKVTTLDPYQGARITFASPVALSGDNRVFQMTIHRTGATLHYDPRTVSIPGQPGPANPNGRYPGPGYPSQAPGFGYPGQPAGGNGRRRRRQNPNAPTVSEVPLIPTVSKLRLQFVLADGRQADVVRPIPEVADAAAGEGWYSVNVPLSILKFAGSTAPMLKSVTVGGDHYGVFFVGRIKLATDTPVLAFTIDGPDHVFPGQPIRLLAKGDPGLSVVEYVWDLGADSAAEPPAGTPDAATGFPAPPAVQVLAGSTTGSEVVARYLTGGEDHTVTLTVTDVDGIKKPATAIRVIHVQGELQTPATR